MIAAEALLQNPEIRAATEGEYRTMDQASALLKAHDAKEPAAVRDVLSWTVAVAASRTDVCPLYRDHPHGTTPVPTPIPPNVQEMSPSQLTPQLQ